MSGLFSFGAGSISDDMAREAKHAREHPHAIIGWSLHFPEVTALLLIDVSQRPDLRDLARVVNQEGKQSAETRWRLQTGCCVDLDILVTRPVICYFVLRFDLDGHRPLLEQIARSGRVAITTMGWVEFGDVLAYPIDVPALRSILDGQG